MIFQQLAEIFSAFSAGRLKTPSNSLRQCAAPSRCEIQLHNNSVVQIVIRISDLIQQIFQPFLLRQSVFHCILLQFLQFRPGSSSGGSAPANSFYRFLAIAFLPFKPEVFSASSILPVLYPFSCWGLCRQSGYTVPADGHRYGRERYPADSSTPSGSGSW